MTYPLAELEGEPTMEGLEPWLTRNSFPLVGAIEKNTLFEARYRKRGWPLVYIFADPKDEATPELLRNVWEVARKCANDKQSQCRYSFVTLTPEAHNWEKMESMGLDSDYAPAVVIDSADGKRHFALDSTSKVGKASGAYGVNHLILKVVARRTPYP